MVSVAIGIALGCAGVLLWPMAPWLASTAGPVALVLALRTPALRVAVAASVLAGLWCALVAAHGLSSRVQEPLHGVVEGCVVSAVLLDGERIRFDLDARRLDDRPVARRLRLSWYEGTAVPAPGECWRLAVKLRPPRGLLNLRGADPERRAFVGGLHGLGYVNGAAVRTGEDAFWRVVLLRARLAAAARIRFLAGEGGYRGLYVALSVGLRHGLQRPAWQVFDATGTGHLVAISGLHVGIVAALGFGAGRWLFGPLLHLAGWRRHTDPQVGWLCALLAAFIYAALAGFSLPTKRALIMVAVLGLSALGRVRVATLDSLSAALAIVLVTSPLSVLAAGTWLSFCAVGVLLTLAMRPPGHPMMAQGVVFAGLLPVLSIFIGRVSLVGPLANAVCVPLFSLLIVPATLLAAALAWVDGELAAGLYALLDGLLRLTWRWLAALADVPLAAWSLPSARGPVVLLALLAVASALTIARSGRARIVALTACLPLVLARAERPAHGDFAVEVFDVGQALAVAISTRRHVVLYDVGAKWRDWDAGAVVVAPQLRAAGVRRLADVVVSHADIDHRGGLPGVASTYAIPRIWTGEPMPGLIARDAYERRCRAGRRWAYDGVRFSILHPGPGHDWRGNDASCVLRVEGRGGSALLTGDIEALAELSLVYRGLVQPVDLVVGQHHGSASSSTSGFVEASAARFVVFSTGFDNRWSLPAQAVVRRWQQAGAEVFDTGGDGAVRVAIGSHASAHRVDTARGDRPAWWRH